MILNCNSALVIGDIAGQFDAMLKLILKSPPAEKIILLGDLNDRGPASREVIEWAMNSKEFAITLDSNHGHMFIDFLSGINIYHPQDFLSNGGGATLKSYGGVDGMKYAEVCELVPTKHVEFLSTCPKFVLINDRILCTHAPLNPDFDVLEACNTDAYLMHSVLWNRQEPVPRPEYDLQIYGHNSAWREHRIGKNLWGTCIDNARRGELMSFHWPSMKVTREVYNQQRYEKSREVEDVP